MSVEFELNYEVPPTMLTTRIRLGPNGMALVEGRDWYRQGGKVILCYKGREQSLTEWATELGMDRQLLINRFNRARKNANARASEYTLEDLFTQGIVVQKVACPLIGLYFASLIKTELKFHQVIGDETCGRKLYARNVCRQCYRAFFEQPKPEDPESARLRQREYATTENGRRIRRDANRRKTLMGLIDAKTTGLFLVEQAEQRFKVERHEAKSIVTNAVKSAYSTGMIAEKFVKKLLKQIDKA